MNNSLLKGIGILAIIAFSYFYFVKSPNSTVVETENTETGIQSPAGSYSRKLAIGYEQNLLLNPDGSFILFSDGALTDQGRWEWDQNSELTIIGAMGRMGCTYSHSDDFGSSIMMGGGEPSYRRD